MRSGYAILSDKTLYMSTDGSAYDAPLVIESDPRLLRDPSPGLNRP